MPRPRSSKASSFRVEYDLDQIDKSLSKLIGKVRRIPTNGAPSFALTLKEGLVEALYAAGIANEGSHIEKKGGHYFTFTLDGLDFTYGMEPYGIREYYKPNTVIIIFYPALTKVGKKTMYAGYNDGETDDVFRKIVAAVAGNSLNAYRIPARTLGALNELSASIPARETATNEVFTTPNLSRTIGSYITKINPANNSSFRRTVRNLNARYRETRKNTNRILRKIAENKNNGSNNNGSK